MSSLKRRSSSVSETTFVATTVIILILLVAALLAFIITLLRYIHRPPPPTVNLPFTPGNTRSFSRPFHHRQQQAPISPPQDRRRPSNTRSHASPFTTPHVISAPTFPLPPYVPSIPPSTLPDPRSPAALRRDELIARLAAMPLTSDTTDDTGFEVSRNGGEVTNHVVMNQSYANWVARRRPGCGDPTEAILIGTDEGTTDVGGEGEQGGGTGDGSGGYRALFSGVGGFDGRERGGDGRVEEDEEPLTPRQVPPAVLKKGRSGN